MYIIWDDRGNGWILSCNSKAERKGSEKQKKRKDALHSEEHNESLEAVVSR